MLLNKYSNYIMEHPKKERTYVMVKPDGLHRSLVGEVISRLERTGLKLVAMKMVTPTREQAIEHYGKDDVWCLEKGERTVKNLESVGKPIEKEAIEYGRDIITGLADLLTCSPNIAMIWEGNQSVGIVKKLVGGTEPLTSDVGTIRGDFAPDSYEAANQDARAVRNLIHCSDEVSEAQREIALWFKEDEIQNYIHVQERMLYDANLDGLTE
ncbi:MAG: nucleoside-diphosphate kinase [Flavobacteriaceae bacterium]|jgi:nucleoside-diphosphate kinase